MIKLGFKLAIAATATLITVNQAQAQYSNTRGRDARVRCSAMRNPFVLNKANVNALVALSCAGLSHNENERRDMEYENSSTMFHQWTTTGGANSINVSGYCAIPYTDLLDGKLERHAIKLNFTRVETNNNKMEVKVRGSIGGKSMNLEFSNNRFMDEACGGSYERNINQLSTVDLGLSFGLPSIQTLIDMVRSQRSGFALNLKETDNWVQGNASGSFSGLGVLYEMSQFSGRRLGLAATTSGSGSMLVVRSANILDHYEGGGYFAFKKDSFGAVKGFANDRDLRRSGNEYEEVNTNNHKFQSVSVDGGAAMVGCSALVFDGELGISQEANLDVCKDRISKSHLGALPITKRIAEITQEEREAQAIKVARANLIRKIEIHIQENYLPARNYTSGPGVYEQGRATWTNEDKNRGYVVVQRNYDLNEVTGVVTVIEHRMSLSGKTGVKKSEFNTKSLQ